MPIVRKLITLGTSKAVILPKSWIEFAEKEATLPMIAVAVEVNKELTITPIFTPKINGRGDTSDAASNS